MTIAAPPESGVAHEVLSLALRQARDAELFWASEDAVAAAAGRAPSGRAAEGVALRVISSGRVGFAVHVGALDTVNPAALLSEARRNAAQGPEAPPTFWKERDSAAATPTWDEAVAALDGKDLARLAHSAASRLQDMLGPIPRDVVMRRVIRRVALITRTAERRSARTIFQCRLQAGPLASSPAVLTETWASGRLPEDPMSILGEMAWKAALAHDVARVEPGRRDVILAPRVAGTLLRWACAALTGPAMAAQTSPLAACMGKRVFDERITLADDPTQGWTTGGAPWDGEGVARRRNLLIDGGVLRGMLLDLASAWKLGLPPTGSAVRAMDTPPVPAPSHLDLAAGDSSFDEMQERCEGGLYVDALQDEAEPAPNGDFRAAVRAGFAIRGGRPAGWVEGMALEGNVFDLLSDHVAAVGADRVIGIGTRCGPLALRDVALTGGDR